MHYLYAMARHTVLAQLYSTPGTVDRYAFFAPNRGTAVVHQIVPKCKEVIAFRIVGAAAGMCQVPQTCLLQVGLLA